MNEAEAVRSFRTFLERIRGRVSVGQIEGFCWFCNDFENYRQAFVDEIENQINQHSVADLNTINYYNVIDAICKFCTPSYRLLLTDRLPRLFQSTLRRCQEQREPLLVEKLGNLINTWGENRTLNDDVLRVLKETFTEVTIPEEREVPVIPQPVVVPVVPQPDVAPVIPQPVVEKRLARGWMRGQVDWETKALEKPELLVIDLDEGSRDSGQMGDVSYVEITPFNERTTCALCSGFFKRAIGPDGKHAFEGVTIVDGKYVHERCLRQSKPGS